MIHKLKVYPEFFALLRCGSKNFEVRKNDRNYKLGDELLLEEFDPDKQEYTGRILHRRVNYIFHGGQFGIEKGYCVMDLKKM